MPIDKETETEKPSVVQAPHLFGLVEIVINKDDHSILFSGSFILFFFFFLLVRFSPNPTADWSLF